MEQIMIGSTRKKIESFKAARDAYTSASPAMRIIKEIEMVEAYKVMVKGTSAGIILNQLLKQGAWKNADTSEAFIKVIVETPFA